MIRKKINSLIYAIKKTHDAGGSFLLPKYIGCILCVLYQKNRFFVIYSNEFFNILTKHWIIDINIYI